MGPGPDSLADNSKRMEVAPVSFLPLVSLPPAMPLLLTPLRVIGSLVEVILLERRHSNRMGTSSERKLPGLSNSAYPKDACVEKRGQSMGDLKMLLQRYHEMINRRIAAAAFYSTTVPPNLPVGRDTALV